MKLFIFAAIVATATAARLEHLQNSYLPPYPPQAPGSTQPNYPTGLSQPIQAPGLNQPNYSAGINQQVPSAGINQPDYATGINQPNYAGISLPSYASGINQPIPTPGINQPIRPGGSSGVSNQYLPPDVGSAASGNVPQFAGSINGFAPPSNQIQPGSQTFGQRYQSQYQSNQYLAPQPVQQYPQQSFDEQTGYHY